MVRSARVMTTASRAPVFACVAAFAYIPLTDLVDHMLFHINIARVGIFVASPDAR